MKRITFFMKNKRTATAIFPFFLLLCISACKKNIDSTSLQDSNFEYKQENLPDFSFAGYKQNKEAIPLVPIVATIYPEEGKDRINIQRAVDSLSNEPMVNGFRGTILLKSGTYYLDDRVIIASSGIIIRGEGQSPIGTHIISTATGDVLPNTISGKQQHAVFSFTGQSNRPQKIGESYKISSPRIYMGSKYVDIEDVTSFQIGDTIVITKTTDENWINRLDMAQYGWTPSQYQIDHIRVITSLSNNSIHFDIPMVDHIHHDEGGGTVTKVSLAGRIENCGIENLFIESVYASDEDENHSWTAIRFAGVTNSWVRNVSAKHFAYSAVSIQTFSDFNTVQDCAFLEPKSRPIGDRRYSFYIGSGMGNLIQRCYSQEGRHDYATGARVTGPNVFLDCYALDSSDETGPHHRWATGALYDNIYAGRIAARNRKGSGTGHGWTAAYNMFWNCHATRGFVVESPPGYVNWIVGGTGMWASGGASIIGFGTQITTRSLFVDQLTNRIGTAKASQILTREQFDQSLWSSISNYNW